MATTSIRTATRDAIITRIKAKQVLAAKRVPVDPGLPGGDAQREHVFVVRITGTRQVAFLEAGRKTIDDRFTISFVFMAANPGATTLDGGDRVEEMATALEDVLADDPTLGDLDGLMWAVSGTWEGPDHELTDEGAVAFIRADVDCRARYE